MVRGYIKIKICIFSLRKVEHQTFEGPSPAHKRFFFVSDFENVLMIATSIISEIFKRFRGG